VESSQFNTSIEWTVSHKMAMCFTPRYRDVLKLVRSYIDESVIREYNISVETWAADISDIGSRVLPLHTDCLHCLHVSEETKAPLLSNLSSSSHSPFFT
jgi:hypothetical protein